MAPPRVVVARSASEMDRLAPLWNELAQHQSHTMFQRFSWNRLAAEMFRGRSTPYVVAVDSDAGAAIIPATINHAEQRLELIGERLFDYRDILHAGDNGILSVAWRSLAETAMPLYVAGIDTQGAAERWGGAGLTDFAPAPQVTSTIDEQGFRLAHSRLGRQLRRLARLGIRPRRYSGKHRDAIAHLYRCKREHFAADVDNIFHDQRRCDFMIALAEVEGSGCEMFAIENEASTIIAGLLTFRDEKIRRFYTIYFHPEWARYSPGVALLYEVTAQSLGDGLTCDYMTGEYPYKMRLANSSRPLHKVALSETEVADVAHRLRLRKAA